MGLFILNKQYPKDDFILGTSWVGKLLVYWELNKKYYYGFIFSSTFTCDYKIRKSLTHENNEISKQTSDF